MSAAAELPGIMRTAVRGRVCLFVTVGEHCFFLRFTMLGRVCVYTRRRAVRGLWKRLVERERVAPGDEYRYADGYDGENSSDNTLSISAFYRLQCSRAFSAGALARPLVSFAEQRSVRKFQFKLVRPGPADIGLASCEL